MYYRNPPTIMEPIVATSQPVPLLDFLREMGPDNTPSRLFLLFDPATMEDETLDVSLFFPFAPKRRCILRFGVLPSTISEAGRYYARLAVFLGKAPGTVQGHLRRLSTVFREAQRRYDIWDFRQLTYGQLESVLHSLRYSSAEKGKMCCNVRYFLMYMSSFCGLKPYDMDMESLDALQRRYLALDASMTEARKTPDVDQCYFDVLLSELPVLAMREDVPLMLRMTAAQLLLELHVGLRPSEEMSLTTRSHRTRQSTSGKKADYLVYDVLKLSQGGRVRTTAECYMLPGAVAAFEMLLRLRTLVPGHEKTDRLYIIPGNLDVSERSYKYRIDKLFLTYFPHLCLKRWEDIQLRTIEGTQCYIPSETQFRVHLCSYLYRQGIRLEVIELGMSHLTDAMIAYYLRCEDRTFTMHQRRSDNIILTQIGNDYAIDASGHKGQDLLLMLPLSLSQLSVYRRRLEEFTQKGYGYEESRYTKLCFNKLSTEIRPALSYLSRLLAQEGTDAVVAAFPSLRRIIGEIDSINNDLTIWENQHRK